VLQANRCLLRYFHANSGTTKADSAVDIEEPVSRWATMPSWAPRWRRQAFAGWYAGDLFQGKAVQGSIYLRRYAAWRCLSMRSTSRPGALEKAAPAAVRRTGDRQAATSPPADASHGGRRDAAGFLPPGALSIVCGSSSGLLDQLSLSITVFHRSRIPPSRYARMMRWRATRPGQYRSG